MNPEHILPQIVLRSWPFGRGISRVMNTLFPNRTFKEGTSIVKTTDGVTLYVIPNDLIGRHIYLTGDYERSVLDVLYSLALPGDVLLDIGANIGYVSSFFLHKVADSRVIAVEPQPAALELLTANLVQFDDRFDIFPVGISDHAGSAHLTIDPNNIGDARISERGEVQVKLTTGDELFSDLSKIDLIKIDVQGHEEKVLKSMQATIMRLRPRAILFEDDGRTIRRISELLHSYKIRAIKKTMLGFKIVEVGSGRYDNYLATLS